MDRRLFLLLLALLLLPVPASSAHGDGEGDGDYIKWVDFDVSYSALEQAMACDIDTYGGDIHLDWIELLAALASGYGGDFSRYKTGDLEELADRLLAGERIDDITAGMPDYAYYFEAYSAVLGEFVGLHRVGVPDPADGDRLAWEERYGLKAYLPIAANFSYTHFDDFGAVRTYGYSRQHLGHDMFGDVGTPIIAVESGTVEVMGWNQYGGWRIGIRSFDGLRYYYYAHLRQNRPYHCDLAEGQVVRAGDVIGYMGRTGYSADENVNGIEQTHLHWGLQLIFHPDQQEGDGEIWVDVYNLSRLLSKNRSETYRVAETKEFYRAGDFDEPNLTAPHAASGPSSFLTTALPLHLPDR